MENKIIKIDEHIYIYNASGLIKMNEDYMKNCNIAIGITYNLYNGY